MKTTTDLIKGTLSFVSFMANGFTVGFVGGMIVGTMLIYYINGRDVLSEKKSQEEAEDEE